MRLTRQEKIYYLLSAISGILWGGLAYFLGHKLMYPFICGGAIVSPLIGLLIGYVSRSFRREDYLRNAFISLGSLYVSAVLFGISCGFYDLLTRFWLNRDPIEVVFQAVAPMVIGTTMFIAFLWPLSAITHLTICSLSSKA
jgi:hypothetical protein